MPGSSSFLRVRLLAWVLVAAALSGCAGTNTIRGQFQYDVRPADKRSELVWPKPPDKPRYRYAGELIGEHNFEVRDKSAATLGSAMKWVIGLFDTSEPFTLQRPQHGVVADNGRIYVVDAGRKAVLVFDPNPPADGKSNKDGGQLIVWDGRDGTVGFAAPMAVAEVWDGDIAVSDAGHGAVVRINRDGQMVGALGEQHLQRPTGLAFDRSRGLLYVADTQANDIKIYESNGLLVDTIGGPGEEDGQLNAPTFLSFVDDHLYVSDTLNSRIQVFDNEGRRVRGFGERGLYIGNMARPKGIALGDAGITYVIESYYGYLLAYNDKNELLLGINGTGAEEDKFTLPSGVWTDKHRRVYVADMFNGRVVVFQLLDAKD
ncbi:MAG TPA: 6-bladed beta-propeller [Noviherbaspirillum sp.]